MLDPRLASRLANLQQHFLDQLSERMKSWRTHWHASTVTPTHSKRPGCSYII